MFIHTLIGAHHHDAVAQTHGGDGAVVVRVVRVSVAQDSLPMVLLLLLLIGAFLFAKLEVVFLLFHGRHFRCWQGSGVDVVRQRRPCRGGGRRRRGRRRRRGGALLSCDGSLALFLLLLLGVVALGHEGRRNAGSSAAAKAQTQRLGFGRRRGRCFGRVHNGWRVGRRVQRLTVHLLVLRVLLLVRRIRNLPAGGGRVTLLPRGACRTYCSAAPATTGRSRRRRTSAFVMLPASWSVLVIGVFLHVNNSEALSLFDVWPPVLRRQTSPFFTWK